MEKFFDFGDAFCYVHGSINKVELEYNDFGEKYDHNPEEAPEYGCGNMKFDSRASTPEVLEKYHITEEEYEQICSELAEGLSFGYCGWCS